MPIRSLYTIEQFEEAFQRLAHSIPKFRKVVCDDFTIVFHYDEYGKPRRITFQMHRETGGKTPWGTDEVEWWSFTIERKLYSNSPHSTKIDFGPYRAVEAKVNEFIQKLMGDTKPKLRFELAEYARRNKCGRKERSS